MRAIFASKQEFSRLDRKPPIDEGARVIFQLNPDNEQGYETERVWAE